MYVWKFPLYLNFNFLTRSPFLSGVARSSIFRQWAAVSTQFLWMRVPLQPTPGPITTPNYLYPFIVIYLIWRGMPAGFPLHDWTISHCEPLLVTKNLWTMQRQSYCQWCGGAVCRSWTVKVGGVRLRGSSSWICTTPQRKCYKDTFLSMSWQLMVAPWITFSTRKF